MNKRKKRSIKNEKKNSGGGRVEIKKKIRNEMKKETNKSY